MIRPARQGDAPAAAPLLILALGHIAGILAKSEHYEDAIPIIKRFFEADNNQYSYANTIVFENKYGVIGTITGYDGALLQQLRKPVLDLLRKSDPSFIPGDETEAGEYYIDCVNVHPDHQGRGIGKKLIAAFCENAITLGHRRIGLIVDMGNPAAKRLYENLGFHVAGERKFMGHRYFHMIKEVQ